jgi:hypothetical protein
MKEHYTQPQIMALGWRAAIYTGYGRLVYAQVCKALEALANLIIKMVLIYTCVGSVKGS